MVSRISTNYFLKILSEQVAFKYTKPIKFFRWKRGYEFFSINTLLIEKCVIYVCVGAIFDIFDLNIF